MGGIALRVSFALAVAVGWIAPTSWATPIQASGNGVDSTTLQRYCTTCHNEKLHVAELALDKLDILNVAKDAATWEKVVRKLRTRSMPPVGTPRPDEAAYDSLAAHLESALDAVAASEPNPGNPASVHRLNKTEYINAVRDLLSVDPEALDVRNLLPADDSTYGFDNIGGVLSVSPFLLERYMSAARKVMRVAMGNTKAAPSTSTYTVSKYVVQDAYMNEELPFGSRGGTVIRHAFPADGEYLIKIRLLRDPLGDKILGVEQQHMVDLRIDGARVKLFPFGKLPKKPGLENEPKAEHHSELLEGDEDANLEARVPVRSGTRSVGVTFFQETSDQEGVLKFVQRMKDADYPSVEIVTVTGPYDAKGLTDTPSRRKILSCRPAENKPGSKEDSDCARKILAGLARQAYRRPVSESDVQPLYRYYQQARQGHDFESAIGTAIGGLLVSPGFLFRVESQPANIADGKIYRLNDNELASRLSFFLWSSLPDEELIAVAQKGKLKDPAILDHQVRRMLSDPRANTLVTNFASQWLYLRNLDLAAPDNVEFPNFDWNLRDAFRTETELFLESILHEDRSLLDILRADYTFLNERLAEHYGISGIFGSRFRRVTMTDENRKGLLGQGSVLMVTSYANRTSPVLRGKWLLENILGAPPPPPPPNVPSLKDRDPDGKILSMRQLMEVHRANPACAVCHARMDPLGFALENFDAIGHWRTRSGADNAAIDSSGTMPDGTKFQGPAELRKILLSRPDLFAGTVIEKMLIYALGRETTYRDAPTVRSILRQAAADNYKWSTVISGIVKSQAFQSRRAQESNLPKMAMQ